MRFACVAFISVGAEPSQRVADVVRYKNSRHIVLEGGGDGLARSMYPIPRTTP